jgi:C_GCAxxG_C_C family probable redox protein
VAQEKLGQELNYGLMKAMGPFGAGLAATGDVCGNVIGALAVFGLMFSRSRAEDKESPLMWKCSQEFQRSFREELGQGSILCRDIIGVDWKDRDQAKQFHDSEKFRECLRITGETAKIVGKMIDQYTGG